MTVATGLQQPEQVVRIMVVLLVEVTVVTKGGVTTLAEAEAVQETLAAEAAQELQPDLRTAEAEAVQEPHY